jgi:UDP-glucose:(heptosyl)LPS alpha-1,3-glucosyltransferase
MKLALVRRGYSPTGGAEAYLKRFAGALAAAGHQPVLYTTDEWPAADWPFELHRLRESRSPWGFARELASLNLSRSADLVFSLERLTACDCYRAGDGVHAAWLARRARQEPFWKPLFRSFQPKHRDLLRLERLMLGERQARVVIVNSNLVGREIVQHYGYPEARLHRVYNGVPPALPPERQADLRKEARRELGLSEEEYVVLFAGSGWERKGLRHAMAAAHAARSRPRLLIAGAGRRSSMPPAERALYLGPVPGLSRTLAAADAFILPTLYDPFSNACLEALAAGLPVITTAANGFSEIITADDGDMVSDPADIAALAGAIDRWAAPDTRAASAMGRRARGGSFSVDENVRKTLEVLESSFRP